MSHRVALGAAAPFRGAIDPAAEVPRLHHAVQTDIPPAVHRGVGDDRVDHVPQATHLADDEFQAADEPLDAYWDELSNAMNGTAIPPRRSAASPVQPRGTLHQSGFTPRGAPQRVVPSQQPIRAAPASFTAPEYRSDALHAPAGSKLSDFLASEATTEQRMKRMLR